MARLNAEASENFAKGFTAFEIPVLRADTIAPAISHTPIHDAFNLGAQLPANDQAAPAFAIAMD